MIRGRDSVAKWRHLAVNSRRFARVRDMIPWKHCDGRTAAFGPRSAIRVEACKHSAGHTADDSVGKERADVGDSRRVKARVLRGLSGFQPGPIGPPWGRELMPKAPLFFHHFGVSIGDSVGYGSHVCAGS